MAPLMIVFRQLPVFGQREMRFMIRAVERRASVRGESG